MWVLRVRSVLQVLRVRSVLQVLRVRSVLQVLKERLGSLVLKERLVQSGSPDREEMLDLSVRLAKMAQTETSGSLDLEAFKVHVGLMGRGVRLGSLVLRGTLVLLVL